MDVGEGDDSGASTCTRLGQTIAALIRSERASDRRVTPCRSRRARHDRYPRSRREPSSGWHHPNDPHAECAPNHCAARADPARRLLCGRERRSPIRRARRRTPRRARHSARVASSRPTIRGTPTSRRCPSIPSSATLIASCGVRNLHPDFGSVYGIPYVLAGSATPRRPVTFDYADESDPGPYPIPDGAPIEGGASSTGDRHVLVVDTAAWKLYELFDAHPLNGGTSWRAGSGAVFDLGSNALRPMYWTSADAAGLPDLPRARALRRGGHARPDRSRRALHLPAHAQGIHLARAPLREQRHLVRAAADGDARAPQVVVRRERLSRRSAGHPHAR